MGSYYIPRNVKGEGRILYIFSIKALIYTLICAGVGFPFYYIIGKVLGYTMVGMIVMGLFALIGFIIGTFKMPEIPSIKFTMKTGGENIDDIIKRAYKFNKKSRRIYVYTKEEN